MKLKLKKLGRSHGAHLWFLSYQAAEAALSIPLSSAFLAIGQLALSLAAIAMISSAKFHSTRSLLA